MKPSRTVTVYRFWVHDSDTRARVFSSFYATRDVIKTVYDSEPVEMTAHEVEAKDIDSMGIYRRLATGWGAQGLEGKAKPWPTQASSQGT
jgi:hypothetical protein